MSNKPDPHDYQVKIWESYLARKKSLDAAALAISERYSQWLITIAGGALGLSLTFLEKIAPNPSQNTTWLMAFSWLFLVFSLLGAFIAIYCSGKAIRKQLEIAEYKHKIYRKAQDSSLPDVPAESCFDFYTKAIPFVDSLSVVSLIFGLFFLCLFSFINLPANKQDTSNFVCEKQKHEHHGYHHYRGAH